MSNSIEELRKKKLELEESLKRAEEEIAKLSKPQVQTPIDVDRIVAFAKEVVEGSVDQDECDHWAFETIMESVYGRDFWNWYNKQTR